MFILSKMQYDGELNGKTKIFLAIVISGLYIFDGDVNVVYPRSPEEIQSSKKKEQNLVLPGYMSPSLLIIYYMVVFIENTIMVALWALEYNESDTLETLGFVGVTTLTFIGICLMLSKKVFDKKMRQEEKNLYGAKTRYSEQSKTSGNTAITGVPNNGFSDEDSESLP